MRVENQGSGVVTMRDSNQQKSTETNNLFVGTKSSVGLKEILFITSFPPRECGIATYSQDLIKALNNQFDQSFKIAICPLESENERHEYQPEIKFNLNTDEPGSFLKLAKNINSNQSISMVLIQHEFGFFENNEPAFRQFLKSIVKPIIVVFHTVLPLPTKSLKLKVKEIVEYAASIIVMTGYSKKVLVNDYGLDREKISIIHHGTHLVKHTDTEVLKEKYNLSGRRVLSTFGLLNSGKSIETTLDAMPNIIGKNPTVIFLIMGKTHPSVVKNDGEKYRKMLEAKVTELQLSNHVKFINSFLPLNELLEYLQLTDIYLFTSNDPYQAVSGTFSYALSCGCPIVSTPIPHAREVLRNNTGIIIDFGSSNQLAEAVNNLLADEYLRKNIASKGLHRMASTAWENSALAHALLFNTIGESQTDLHYNNPPINLDHIKNMTTEFGMIQFSKINQPDIDSGYTLDDNARAMIALCQHYEITREIDDLKYISLYLNFIKICMQSDGSFLNYVDEEESFTSQNYTTNLADSNGRAIWALGFLLSIRDTLPKEFLPIATIAENIMKSALKNVAKIHSPRAMAFIIKGLYYANKQTKLDVHIALIKELSDRLVQMYRHEAHNGWQWYESYLTYANGILPEALLCAWLATGNSVYKEIAKASFDFLLSKTFVENNIKVISNKNWLHKGENAAHLSMGGEQPIDVAYTIIALSKFHGVFPEDDYIYKMEKSFSWFLGNNHLNQIIYNPCTGGCYDGLEINSVNLNQGAESAVSFFMARMTIEKAIDSTKKMNYSNKPFHRKKRVKEFA